MVYLGMAPLGVIPSLARRENLLVTADADFHRMLGISLTADEEPPQAWDIIACSDAVESLSPPTALSTVMPARACRRYPRLSRGQPSKQGVDGRDIRAFTSVFDGLLPGHDSRKMVQRDRNALWPRLPSSSDARKSLVSALPPPRARFHRFRICTAQ